MAGTPRSVTAETLGAWLLKGSPDVSAVHELIGSGFRTVTHRCVRASYRTDLVEPGQPVLFWVSGGDPASPAGLYAQGRTTGVPTASEESDGRAHQLDLPVRLVPLAAPVLREELRTHPTLRRIEVLRMAAGSNPSYLTRHELEELRAQWPQVTVGPTRA